MKQGNVAAPSRIVHDERIKGYFKHHGHRTAVSQRALQAHADPWLGYTEIDGTGFVVSELSPYVEDLDWSDLTEPRRSRRSSTTWAGRRPRSTASPTRTRTPPSSASRPRTRSSRP
jgi:hypothetical protein